MYANTKRFLRRLEAGHMPNVIELMLALDQMSDECYESFVAAPDLAEATKACRLIVQHGRGACGECG